MTITKCNDKISLGILARFNYKKEESGKNNGKEFFK